MAVDLTKVAQRRGPLCPRCKKKMVLRKVRATGEQFWGCSQYPDCKGTLSKEEADKRMDTEALQVAEAMKMEAADRDRKKTKEQEEIDKNSEFLAIQRQREKDSPW